MNIKKIYVGFKNNVKTHGLPFHYTISTYHMLGVGYVDVRWIPCIWYACLR